MIRNKFFTTSLFLLVCLLITNNKSHAQQTDFQAWSLLTADISIGEENKWSIYLEGQARLADDFGDFERTLLRPALGYNLNKNLTFYLGYAWTPTYINSDLRSDFRNEHRIWQQIVYKHTDLNLNWLHRLRQEQRFIDDASNTANRTRYLLKASYPFSDKACINGLAGYNEIFVNLNSVRRGPDAGFDRWRFFFGPYIEKENARYEFGYVGELAKRFGDDERMINALFLSANFKY